MNGEVFSQSCKAARSLEALRHPRAKSVNDAKVTYRIGGFFFAFFRLARSGARDTRDGERRGKNVIFSKHSPAKKRLFCRKNFKWNVRCMFRDQLHMSMFLFPTKLEKSDSSARKRKVWCLAKAFNKVRLYQNSRTEPQGYSHRCKNMRNGQCLQEIIGEIYIYRKYIPYRVKVSWIHQLMLKGELKHMEKK